jgi:hypothetical protein
VILVEKAKFSAKRMLGYATIGLLVLAALPTFGVAASKAQDVFITNDPANPVPVKGEVSVANFPTPAPTRQDMSGAGFLWNAAPNLELPDGLRLTDLVAEKSSGDPGACAVSIWYNGDGFGARMFNLEPDDAAGDEVHFETGLEIASPGFSVFQNSGPACGTRVTWAGYMMV